MDRFCGMIHDSPDFWIKMGDFESEFLRDEIDALKIEKPLYVSGLARSGSTILLEILSRYSGVVSHCYKDFPPVFTPYWWNWFLKGAVCKKQVSEERAHKDRIYVTPDSPEAVEEVLWMAFFQHIHDITVNNVLDSDTCHAHFEKFYTDHVRKLLLVRKGNRYLAKANYNITRLEYLLKLFPDARFVIPVRDPVDQIKSLIKQHGIFIKGQKEDPRAITYLKRIGHFEFGQDFRPINTGHTQQNLEIKDLLNRKEHIAGWAKYWNQVYGYIARRLMENESLGRASMVIRYESLCSSPANTIHRMQKHCGLAENKEIIFEYEKKIKPPEYYQMVFSQEEDALIRKETREALGLIDNLSPREI